MASPDMITQYLASRGAAPSAENASRVRQHYAANPDLLDRRAMGLPGGLDDNSSVLDAMLDKHVAESMPAPAGTVTVGQPEQIPPPSRTQPAAKGPGEVGGTNTARAGAPSNKGNYGPGPSPSRQPNYDSAPTATGQSTSNPALTGDVLAGSGSQVGDTQRSGLGEWLIGLLSSGAGLYGLSKMGGKGAAPDAGGGALPGMTPPGSAPATAAPDGRTPAPYGTDLRTPATDNPVAGTVSIPGEQAARNDMNKQMIERQVQMENDAMMQKMAEDAARNRRTPAQDTVDAAKRLFRRK